MEKEVKVFEPVGDYGILLESQRVISVISEAKRKMCLKSDLTEMENEVNEKVKEVKGSYEELLNYFRGMWGKYVHMKFFYNANYSATRDTEPDWKVTEEYNALVYQYNPVNDCLFGVYSVLNSPYVSYVQDKSISLCEKMTIHRLEVNEITREDFLEQAQQASFNCLNHRIEKIESGEYILSENGFKYNIDAKFNNSEGILDLID